MMRSALTIDDWNWRYRVGFDASCRERVRSAMASLHDSSERAVMEEVYSWATSFVSIHALLDSLLKSQAYSIAEDRRLSLALVEEAISKKERILWLPFELRAEIEPLLGSMPSVVREAAFQLVEKAELVEPRVPPHSTLFAITFGDELGELVRAGAVSLNVPQLRPGVPVPLGELSDVVKRLIGRSLEDPRLCNLFGAWTPPPFEIEMRHGAGFGEYWPHEISRDRKAHDKLIVYSNPDSRQINHLQATLYHEVYPGHGFFYDNARRSHGFVDHGATTLIEGWATWCEWEASGDLMSRFERSTRLRLHRFFESTDPASIPLELMSEVKLHGLSAARANQVALHYFQYPGLIYSYSLGALWLEKLFQRISPARFIELLSARSWGDFFRCWRF